MLFSVSRRCANFFKLSRGSLSRCLRGMFPSGNGRITAKVEEMPSGTNGGQVLRTRDHERKEQTITVKSAKNCRFSRPKSVKQLRGFLGLTGYFRKYIKSYISIGSPLNEATSVKDSNGKP